MGADTIELEVLAPGLLTSVQDARGRPGFERYGVPTGGAADALAAEAANLLVGNPPDAALLEITLSGPTLRFGGATAFALAGADLGAALDGQGIAPGWSWLARAGSVLEFGERCAGVRAYLAVAGGFLVPMVLGSAATDLLAGFGGLERRALRAGDRLAVPGVPDVVTRSGRHLPEAGRPPDPEAHVRVLPGPHLDHFVCGTLEALCAATWRITDEADRMGYRLAGPRLRHVCGADVLSLGLPVGAVQVPGDGQPIVLLADHQPTGGYAVLACVIRADLRLLTQRAPGESVRFALTTPIEARAALCAQRATLEQVQAGEDTWAPLRWAGTGP